MNKNKVQKDELKNMDIKVLEEKLSELRKEALMLRLNSATTHVKDYSQFLKIRRDIARVLTFISQQSATK